MRLPKWVVKWVKDDFDFEWLELKCKQQEEEIKILKGRIAALRFELLPKEEREGVERVYSMMKWPIFWRWKIFFIQEYLKRRDEDGICDSLPF